MVICYTIPEIWRVTNLIIFIVGYFLSFYPSKSPKNQNLKKFKKNPPVPEIWQVTGIIVTFHFGIFFALLHPPP